MNTVSHNPRIVQESASWDPMKFQYRCLEYGQTVALLSSKRRAQQWLASTRRELRRLRNTFRR